jgi:RNA polymerase sigma-70 factor, ECF subfamily
VIDTDECSGDLRATIDAAIGGNRDAFGTLYGRYWPSVRGYIGLRLHDRGTAEDLTQEVFRRAFVAIGRYEHRGVDFGAFVVTIARNLVADYYKGGAYRLAAASVGSQELLVERADDDRWSNPEYCAVHGAAVAALTEALGQLTTEQQTCIELRFLRGLSVAETAAAVGKNEGAVKALLHRATSALRRDPALEALR